MTDVFLALSSNNYDCVREWMTLKLLSIHMRSFKEQQKQTSSVSNAKTVNWRVLVSLGMYSLKINESNQSSQAGVYFFQLNSC